MGSQVSTFQSTVHFFLFLVSCVTCSCYMNERKITLSNIMARKDIVVAVFRVYNHNQRKFQVSKRHVGKRIINLYTEQPFYRKVMVLMNTNILAHELHQLRVLNLYIWIESLLYVNTPPTTVTWLSGNTSCSQGYLLYFLHACNHSDT